MKSEQEVEREIDKTKGKIPPCHNSRMELESELAAFEAVPVTCVV